MRTLLAALAALALAAAPASAAAPAPVPAGPGPSAAATAGDAALVRDFLAAYRDAVRGSDPGLTPSEVRAEWLAPELNARLDAWRAGHPGADPVFRAATAPDSWAARPAGSAGGLALVTVDEQWAGGAVLRVRYAVRQSDRTVADLRDTAG
ncbi:hypothetical protein [Kitasatospora sp. DSM 101779]|uniref:hypothetical protein n=1 Tax=Kitasatospora sp. DSM 101779 TaxID=2853165 RepID=UPI0021D99E1E|nr:hypothetical protein [Kitasatospora sp. DSM 101779]MCU7823833.1 hypothetical protein [Kitasatospora sp. DSM 101779]